MERFFYTLGVSTNVCRYFKCKFHNYPYYDNHNCPWWSWSRRWSCCQSSVSPPLWSPDPSAATYHRPSPGYSRTSATAPDTNSGKSAADPTGTRAASPGTWSSASGSFSCSACRRVSHGKRSCSGPTWCCRGGDWALIGSSRGCPSRRRSCRWCPESRPGRRWRRGVARGRGPSRWRNPVPQQLQMKAKKMWDRKHGF